MDINRLALLASALNLNYKIANNSVMLPNTELFNPQLNSRQLWDVIRVLEISITFEDGYVTVGNSSYSVETVNLPQAIVNAAVEKLTCTKL